MIVVFKYLVNFIIVDVKKLTENNRYVNIEQD